MRVPARALSTIALAFVLAFPVPALGDSQAPEARYFSGNAFRDLIRYGFEVLPGLGPLADEEWVTGSASVDARIWDLAYQRGYRLQPLADTDRLVSVDGFLLQPEAAAAWEELKAAAAEEGYQMALTSAYRSVATQRSVFLKKLYGTSSSAINARLAFSAPPGASRHHTGYTIDVKQLGGSHGGFGNTPAFRWISADNSAIAKRFGFVPSYPPGATDQGPNPEAWEYVYVGHDLILHDGPFTDVLPNHIFVESIAWLAERRITLGCSSVDQLFCPYDSVDRGQIAAFLKRALLLPPTVTDYFDDDEESIFQDDINRLAAAGITKGCNPPANDWYCPDHILNRGEMAAMLRRALDLPSSPNDHFVDDNQSTFEGDINAIADAGITFGCGGGNYCPERDISRGEFAAMLHRARALLP